MSLPQIRTKPLAKIELPVQFSRLRDIAYNLWWSWTPSAQALFEMIDYVHWQHYRNPIEVLIDLDPERWHFLQNDIGFLRAYRALVAEFDAYMAPEQPTWFERRFPGDGGPVVYLSTEYGWHESLQSYSGGLGLLSGDHSKSASDLGLPFVGIGLMYRRGYFHQTIDAEGQQQHFYPNYDVSRLPLLPVLDPRGQELRVAVELPGRHVMVRAWKASVGRVPVLLLDCDLPANHPADRSITSILYIRGREMRMCQELVLGVGGARVLRALGIVPAVWHMNEGHSALLSLERIGEVLRREGLPFDEVRRRVAMNAVFTTHTPVPAGNETFESGLVRHYLRDLLERLGLPLEPVLALGRGAEEGEGDRFNLTALAIRTSSRCNAVSELHGRVAGEMWRSALEADGGRGMEFVTNGVHLPTWVGREIGELLRRHLGPDFADHLCDPGFAEAVLALPDGEVWQAHEAQKRRLVLLVRELMLAQLSRHGRSPEELHALDRLLEPGSLLVGFARRFATYKRADLLLRDMEQLRAIVGASGHPVQFLYAGKAHPADRPGQDLIRRIFQASRSPELLGRLAFLENYDIRIGRGMVQGVDVWLNSPRRPMEASGTSGMKAAMNGALNCSVLDGWWCEGYDPAHGWVVGQGQESADHESQDREDAQSLYRVFRDEIVPCYYARDERGLPVAWIRRMKLALGQLSPRFSTTRMVREYAERYYVPLGSLDRHRTAERTAVEEPR